MSNVNMGCCQSRIKQRQQLLTTLLRQAGQSVPAFEQAASLELYTPSTACTDPYLQLSYVEIPNYLLYPVYTDCVLLYPQRDHNFCGITSHYPYFQTITGEFFTRSDMLAQYRIPEATEKSLPTCLRNQKVVYPDELEFVVEGLRFRAVRIRDDPGHCFEVEFESEGLVAVADDTEIKDQREQTLAQLTAALASNEAALIEAEATKELSDVGALYLERKTITAERDRLTALAIPPSKQVYSIKVTLVLGWNRVFGTWVNLSDLNVARSE